MFDSFQIDKANLKTSVTDYINTHPEGKDIENRKEELNTSINAALDTGDLNAVIALLNEKKDVDLGIAITYDDDNKVVIKDARNAQKRDENYTYENEYKMQFINSVRAANDIIDIEITDEAQKTAMKASLLNNVKAFMSNGASEGFVKFEPKSADEYKTAMYAAMGDVANLLKENGVEKAAKKMNQAKEFQTYNDKQYNPVTITEIDGVPVIESEVGLRQMTDAQKAEYTKMNSDTPPGWFADQDDFSKGLLNKYSEEMTAGTHVMPTQILNAPGLRNAFEKNVMVFEGGELNTLKEMHHSGTVVAFTKTDHAELTKLNAEQAQAWVGEDSELVYQTLNSQTNVFNQHDMVIQGRTKAAMTAVGAGHFNTAFNIMRNVPGTNDYAEIEKDMSDYVKGKEGDGVPKRVSDYIQGKTTIFRRIADVFSGKSQADFAQAALNEVEGLDESTKKALEAAIDTRHSINSISTVASRFRRDPNNNNLSISNSFSNFRDAANSELGEGEKKTEVTACKSGKDRTGLDMHNKTVEVLADHFGKSTKDVHNAVIKGSHTANQAGDTAVGGGTGGCVGTKSENKGGIPKDKSEYLDIVLDSANSNKISEEKCEKAAANLEKLNAKYSAGISKVQVDAQINKEQEKGAEWKKTTPTQEKAENREKIQDVLNKIDAEIVKHAADGLKDEPKVNDEVSIGSNRKNRGSGRS